MPLRRDFLRTVGLGATALALPKRLSAESAAAAAPASRPHILLIHVDEHRMECLGAYGNRDVKTPHIDGLAADGVRYDLSFCAFPVCTPSRYSLVSGLLPQDHGGLSNGSTLAPEIETFPKILQVAGYRTKAIGKMHYRPTYLDVGFSEMELSEQAGAGRWDDDYHRDLMRRVWPTATITRTRSTVRWPARNTGRRWGRCRRIFRRRGTRPRGSATGPSGRWSSGMPRRRAS